jgi:hypothetical protein
MYSTRTNGTWNATPISAFSKTKAILTLGPSAAGPPASTDSSAP